MKQLAPRRGRARLALAVLAATAMVPARAAPAWPEEAANPTNRATGGAPPPAGPSTPEPVRVFTDARGRTCRVYERRVLIDGAPHNALATICREPNGRWVLSR